MSANKPAFPRPCADVETTDRDRQPRYNTPQDGMTMRQYYKAAALQGWAAGRNAGSTMVEGDLSEPMRVANACARYADAMLVEDEEHAK